MSTPPLRPNKQRLITSNNISQTKVTTATTTTTTNGHSISSRNGFKRPSSTNNLLQQHLTNGFPYRRRISAMNNLNSTIKSSPSDEQIICHQNGHHYFHPQCNGKLSTNGSETPPLVFHAIAPAPSPTENNGSTDNQQLNNGSTTAERIERVLAHSVIKTMTTGEEKSTGNGVSSCSDNDTHHRRRAGSPSTATDEEESDDDTRKKIVQQHQLYIKSRRPKKTRKTSSALLQHQTSSTPPSSKSLIRKDESQQQKQQLSSNDEDNTEPIAYDESSPSFTNGTSSSNRRNKFLLSAAQAKRNDNFTTTTTDDDGKKHHHHHHPHYYYHPLNVLEVPNGKRIETTTNESNCSSPVPIMTVPAAPAPARKATRFQVKSIRKSQQQQMLLANAAAAKSSNEDDCSVPTGTSIITSKALLIQRKHTMTPTTDCEQPPPPPIATTTENLVNRAVSTLNQTMVNGHHRVRFQVAPHAKQESAAEEEKIPVAPTATITPTPTPAPVSAPGEDDEEEEATGKSPDNRFVKYAKEIGRGAFKTVYRGLDTETSVNVAWCELQDFAQFDKHERARFKEEAEMLKKLQHPNIVGFFDFWEETNPRTNKKVIILVTELMTSGSLKGYIRKFKGQKEDKRINVMKKWCRQILKGLAYLHSRNPPVIHRDLKCDNVFISGTTGCVKIGDLGLATFKTQTFAKSMRGTMEFMAPEMFDEKYDELVDIYSFGLCMLEMITGEYPYVECKFPTAVIKRVTSGLKPDCYYKVENEDVREVIDCCIRTSKEERLPVHELLQHSFFLDDNGLRIDIVRDPSNDSQVINKNDSIDLKLKIIDKTKRKALWTEHEAIRFPFNLKTDTAEQIADELIGKKYIFEEDKNFIIQATRDRLRAYKYEQIDRKAGVYCREGKPPANQTSQSSVVPQPQQPQVAAAPPQPVQQPPTPAAVVTTNPIPVIPPQIVQQPPIELQQVIKPSAEILSTSAPVKSAVVSTEPVSITQLSDLGNNLPGSAGSLEALQAALQKTFNKMNAPSGASAPTTTTTTTTAPTTSTQISENSEPPTPTIVSEEPPMTRLNSEQQAEDPAMSTPAELSTNIFQVSNPAILQTQSQPTTMLTNQQQQMLQTAALHLPQPSQSFSHSIISNNPTSLINNSLPNNESQPLVNGKSLPPPPPPSTASDSSTTENTHIPISPTPTPLTNDAAPSDTTPPVQTQSLGSLQQLEVLLLNTFKKPCKTTGTAHSSDSEAANVVASLPTIPTNEESKGVEPDFVVNEPSSSTATKMDEMKRKIVDLYSNSGCHPAVSSLIHSSHHPHSQSHPQLTLVQSTPVQPSSANSMLTTTTTTNQQQQSVVESTHFDPLTPNEISGSHLHELETLLKSTFKKSPSPVPSSIGQYSNSTSNDDTLTSTPIPSQRFVSNNDMYEIKSMIVDLGQTLLAKMNALEIKIINHHQQTVQVKEMITDTVLPSILDLADIIHQTSSSTIDPRVRTRLEQIQTRVRTTQQGMLMPEHETKNLMEI